MNAPRLLLTLLLLAFAPLAHAGYCDGVLKGESISDVAVSNCVKLPGTFTFATLPNSTSIKIGTTAYTSDQGSVVFTSSGWISVGAAPGAAKTAESFGASPGASAAANVTAINAALASGQVIVTLNTPGVYSINSPLIMSDNTDFRVGPGVTIQEANASNVNLLINSHAYDTPTVMGTLTSSGLTATLNWPSHGLSVGNWFSILGAQQGDYDGVFQVASVVDANNITYNLDNVPSATTATPLTPPTLSSLTYAAGVCTMTFATSPGISNFTPIVISGGTPSAVNGTFSAIPTANDGTTTTYLCPATSGSGTATGTITVTPTIYAGKANFNIKISGPGTFDYNGANQTITQSYLEHGLLFHNAALVSVRNVNVFNVLKYAIAPSNVRDLNISDVYCQTLSNCVQIVGPLQHGSVSRIFGYGGDDFIAMAGADYAFYELARGNLEGIEVNDIHTYGGSTAGVAIQSGPNFVTKSVSINGVYGSVSLQGVRMQPDFNLGSVNASYISLRNIRLNVGNGAGAEFHAGGLATRGNVTIAELEIDGLSRPVAGSSSEILLDTNSTITHASFKNIVDTQTTTVVDTINALNVVNTLDISHSTASVVSAASSPFAHFLHVNGSATINALNISDTSITGLGANARFVTNDTGAITKLATFRGVTMTTGHSIFEQANTTGGADITLAGVYANGLQQVEALSGPTNTHINGLFASGLTNITFQLGSSSGAGNYNFDGALGTPSGRLINKLGSGTVCVYGDTLTINIAQTSNCAGELAYDTSTSCHVQNSGSNWFFSGVCPISPAFAASYTPVMIPGTANGANIINMGALTAAITINNPATIPPAGSFQTFNFLQDGTGGRAVSWGAAYQFPVAFSNVGNAANTRASVTFTSDGTNLWENGQNTWH